MSAVAPQTPLELARRFWRWWTAELRECIPTRFVAFLTRLSVLPLVVPEGDGYSIYRFDGTNWKRVAGVRAGDSTEATAKALGAQLKSVRATRFAVALPNGQFLSKILQLPAVAEENLRNAIGYELDRHTPFKPEDVGYDCCVIDRNETAREIAVRLVIAHKANIAQAMERVAGSGVLVAAE